MLPRAHRLPLRFTRNYIEESGKVIHSPLFTILVAPSMISTTNPTRFAFIVSKKIDKLAVVRNSLKRKLAGALLPLLSKLSPGTDAIFFVKQSLKDADPSLIQETLKNTLKHANLLT